MSGNSNKSFADDVDLVPDGFAIWINALFVGGNCLPIADEQALYDELLHHGMIPLVLSAVSAQRVHLPAGLLAQLQNQSRQEMIFCLESTRVLEDVCTRLATVNITPILFKGAALIRQCFDGPGLRPRSDSDMLVATSDFDQAANLLSELGFVDRAAQGGGVSSALTFDRPGRFGLTHTIDLHKRISSLPHPIAWGLDYATVKGRSECCAGIRVLCPVDALLLAAFHRAQHFTHLGTRLIWLYDIHLLLQRLSPDDVEQLTARSEQWVVGSVMRDALIRAEECFGTKIPALLLSSLIEDASQVMFSEDMGEGAVSRFLLGWSHSKGVGAKLAFAFRKLFPPISWMRTEYGVSSVVLPFFYVLRLFSALRMVLAYLRRSRSSGAVSSS